MSDERTLFSESWHRVANLRIRLRATLQVHRQHFRGERWHVLRDPFTNRFYRFRPEAHELIGRLTGERTVEEVWKLCLERDPEGAPGQEDVIRILAQLHHANLIQSEIPPDSAKLFERQAKQRQREIASTLASILFVRIPLWDPQRFLRATWPFVRPFFSRWMAAIWLLVVGAGVKVVAENFDALRDRTQEILAPGNLPLLFATFFVIKALHEMGHAYACTKFGGEVHTMGIMLLVFSPIPFVDASSAWAFRERWKRVFVGAAGMLVELFLAAIAAFIWQKTGAGLINSLAYNALFMASVTTVLFNLNPLLRFDGYYILSDLTDTPNLQQRATQQIRYLAERFAFGLRQARSVARHGKEATWLVLFGLTSRVYRLFIFAAIILFVADKFFGLGLIAAVIGTVGLFVVPLVKYVRYLAADPRLARCRRRAVIASLLVVTLVAFALAEIPFPRHFRAPGVLKARAHSQVVAGAAGRIADVVVESNSPVQRGTLLVRLDNPELDFDIARTEAQRREVLALIDAAHHESIASLEPLQGRLSAVDAVLAELRADRAELQCRAPLSGTWAAPRTEELNGAWAERGTVLGQVIGDGSFELHVVVPQQHASDLFEGAVREVELRLPGEAGLLVPVTSFRTVPGQQELLPSRGLGWAGGGPVKVDLEDPGGVRAAEPFFLVVATLARDAVADAAPLLLHDRTGLARFELPPEPLLWQWVRKLRQLLQSRFQL